MSKITVDSLVNIEKRIEGWDYLGSDIVKEYKPIQIEVDNVIAYNYKVFNEIKSSIERDAEFVDAATEEDYYIEEADKAFWFVNQRLTDTNYQQILTNVNIQKLQNDYDKAIVKIADASMNDAQDVNTNALQVLKQEKQNNKLQELTDLLRADIKKLMMRPMFPKLSDLNGDFFVEKTFLNKKDNKSLITFYDRKFCQIINDHVLIPTIIFDGIVAKEVKGEDRPHVGSNILFKIIKERPNSYVVQAICKVEEI